jgi:hypothetical protein
LQDAFIRARLACSSSFALLLLALVAAPRIAHAQLPPAPAVEQDPSDEARKYFQIGVELLQDPDGARYEEALKSFRHAYEISPSWKILGNFGLSALKLERCVEAIEAYERYLSAGGSQIEPAEREQIQRDLDIMKSSTGSVTLHVLGGAAVTVNDTRQRSVGGPVVNSYQLAANQALTLRLVAGRHSIVANAGGKQASLELDINSDTKLDQELDLDKSSAPAPLPVAAPLAPASLAASSAPAEHASGSSLRTVGIVVGGVGVAALVGGAVTGIVGAHKQSTLNGKCPDYTCSYHSAAEKSSFDSDKASLRTLGTATTALLIGGGVLTATGITLFFSSGPKQSERIGLTTLFGPSGGSIVARGAF